MCELCKSQHAETVIETDQLGEFVRHAVRNVAAGRSARVGPDHDPAIKRCGHDRGAEVDLACALSEARGSADAPLFRCRTSGACIASDRLPARRDSMSRQRRA